MATSPTRAFAQQWFNRLATCCAAIVLSACSGDGTEFDVATDATIATHSANVQVSEKATSDWSVVTTNDNGDGYVRFGDGTWQWLDSACLGTLRDGGTTVTSVQWSEVSALTQVSAVATCDEVANAMSGSGGTTGDSWSVVTTNDNGDGYVRFGDSTWQWLDAACVSRLQNDGITVQRVQWQDVSSLQQVSGQATCDDVAANAGSGSSSGGGSGGGSGGDSSWSVVTTNDSGDGYVRFGDDTWQWLSSTCVASLQSAGVAVTRVEWNTVSSLTQVSGQASCDEVSAELSDSSGGGGGSGGGSGGGTNSSWSVVTTGNSGDGYVRFGDGTRQWLDAACISSVRNAGVAVTAVDWNDVKDLSQVNGATTCDDVIATIDGSGSGGGSGGSGGSESNWSLVSTDTSGAGYVRFGDGTWQWLDSGCISNLSNAGYSATAVQWSEVSSLTQVSGQVTCEAVLAELSGDSGTIQTFKVAEFFKSFNDQGATYSLTGTFDNGGVTSEQRHEIDRSPGIDTPQQWRGQSDLTLNSILVERYVNGDAGVTDTYQVYADSNGDNFGDETVADGSVRVNFGGSNAPDTVSSGQFGTGDTIYMFDGEAGAVFTGTRKDTWKMTRNSANDPVYCVKTDEYDASNNYVWSFESCYGIDAGTGDPSGYISYSYTSGSNSGFIDGENLRLGGTPLEPDPVTLPTLAVQAATIDFNSAQNGVNVSFTTQEPQVRITVTWPDGHIRSYDLESSESPLTIKTSDHAISTGTYNVAAVAINNVGRESDSVTAVFSVGSTGATTTLACKNQNGATNARLFASGGDAGYLRVNGTDTITNGDYDFVTSETVGSNTRYTYQKLQPDQSENVLIYEREADSAGNETTTYYAEALAGSDTYIECGDSIAHNLGTANTRTALVCRTNYRTYNSATRSYYYTFTAWRHARTGYYGDDAAFGRYNDSTDTLSTTAYTSYYSGREWTLVNVNDDNSLVTVLTDGWRRYADSTEPRHLTIDYNTDGRVRWIADRVSTTNWTYCKPFIAR